MKTLNILKKLVICIGLLLAADFALGETRYSVANDNWSSTATWSATSGGSSGASVPAEGDDVIIEGGYNVTIDASATCNNIAIESGASLTISSSNSLTVSGNWVNNGGSFTPNSSMVTFNGVSKSIGGTSSTTFYNMSLIGSASVSIGVATTISHNLSIGNGTTFTAGAYNLTVTGTTTVGGGASGSLIISSATGTKTFEDLVTVAAGATWNNSGNSDVTFKGGITKIGTGAFTSGTGIHTFVANNQALTGVTLIIPKITVTGITLTNKGTVIVGTSLDGSGTFLQDNFSTLYIGGTSTITTLTATSTENTVSYNGTDQTVNSTNFYHLKLEGSGTYTLQAGTTSIIQSFSLIGLSNLSVTAVTGLTIGGIVYINSNSTFDAASYTHNFGGDFQNSGTFTAGTSTIQLNGSLPQSITGSTTTIFNNLTVNNSSGVVLGISPTVNGTLTFSNGKISTGEYRLIVGSSGDAKTISGAGAGKYIYGNLRRYVTNTSNPTIDYPIGDAGNYTPVSVTFAGTVSGSGYLDASTSAIAPASGVLPAGAGLSATRYIKRRWVVNNTNVGGFDSYSPSFTFVAGDIQGSVNTSNLVVRKLDGSTWTTTTIGTRTSTSTQAITLASFSEFGLGEDCVASPSFTSCPSNINQGTDNGSCTAVVTYNAIATGDPTPTVSYVLTGVTTGSGSGTGSGSAFNIGVTTVTITAANGCSPDATCSFTVTIAIDYGTVSSGNETICYGGDPSNITFSTAPSGGSGTFNYQWYYQNAIVSCPSGTSTSGWNSISGATDNSYDPASGLTTSRTYAVQVDPGGSPDCGDATWATSCRKVTVYNSFTPGAIVATGETICYNGNPSEIGSTTPASGGDGSISYQWLRSDDEGFTSPASISSNTTTYDPPAGLTSTTWYRRQARETTCNTSWETSTGTWKVTVQADPTAGTIATPQVICYNTAPTALSSTGAGTGSGAITYEWQTNASGSFADISGATDATYQPPSLTFTTSYQRRTKSVSGGITCYSGYTTAVEIIVNNVVTAGAIGTAQVICNGTAPAALTSGTAGTGSGTITYEWQTNASGSYANISGATDATYQPPALTATTSYQRRTVSLSGGTTCYSGYTTAVEIIVNNVVTAGAIGTAQVICNGTAPAALTSGTAGTGSGTITYEWQTNASGSFADISDATDATYQPPALTSTTSYQRRTKSVSGGTTCYSGYTSPVEITVNNQMTAGTIAAPQVICYNTASAALSSTGAGTGSGTITYEWQTNASGSFADISGATDATYQPPALTSTTSYQRRTVSLSGSKTCYSDYTSPVQITVNNQMTAGTISAPQVICYNTAPAALTSSEAGTGSGTITYEWQTNATGSFADISGATDATYQPPALTSTTSYQRRSVSLSGGTTCYSGYTTAVEIIVNNVLTAGAIEQHR